MVFGQLFFRLATVETLYIGLKVNTSQHQKHNERNQPYLPALEIAFSFMSTKALWLLIQLDVRLVSQL